MAGPSMSLEMLRLPTRDSEQYNTYMQHNAGKLANSL